MACECWFSNAYSELQIDFQRSFYFFVLVLTLFYGRDILCASGASPRLCLPVSITYEHHGETRNNKFHYQCYKAKKW